MGLLDSLVSEITESGNDSVVKDMDLGSITKALVSSSGNSNLDTIMSTLKENGLEDKVTSWVGSGANEALQAADLDKALDSNVIDELAQNLGVEKQQVSGVLSAVLPALINQLSPEGKTGDDGSLLTSGMQILKGFL